MGNFSKSYGWFLNGSFNVIGAVRNKFIFYIEHAQKINLKKMS
jgi:hypothetical protein